MFNCEKLSFAHDLPLFSELGFCLKPASVLVLAGTNGSGKTTLLRCLAGLLLPSAGQVHWLGKNVQNNADYQASMLYIAHLNACKPELNVYDNVQYFAALKGTQMLVPAALQFFGLMPYVDMPVSQLSAGWQRRVSLARLLAIPAIVWLLDEPMTNLDQEGQRLLEGLIITRLRQGGIVIMTSHQPVLQNTQVLDMSDFKPVREFEYVD
jgi:heme exporter protein A